ncbi:MAG TPA: hypothetical protein VIK32_08785, partial [Candidatus Limnocylindrales bacterium]
MPVLLAKFLAVVARSCPGGQVEAASICRSQSVPLTQERTPGAQTPGVLGAQRRENLLVAPRREPHSGSPAMHQRREWGIPTVVDQAEVHRVGARRRSQRAGQHEAPHHLMPARFEGARWVPVVLDWFLQRSLQLREIRTAPRDRARATDRTLPAASVRATAGTGGTFTEVPL